MTGNMPISGTIRDANLSRRPSTPETAWAEMFFRVPLGHCDGLCRLPEPIQPKRPEFCRLSDCFSKQNSAMEFWDSSWCCDISGTRIWPAWYWLVLAFENVAFGSNLYPSQLAKVWFSETRFKIESRLYGLWVKYACLSVEIRPDVLLIDKLEPVCLTTWP